MKYKIISCLFGVLTVTSCVIPSHLQKYPKAKNLYNSLGINDNQPQTTASEVNSKNSNLTSNKKEVQLVNDYTYRFNMPEKDVWDSALQVLIQNYNINTIDRGSGIITTEWDTVYLNDGVYRNKISMRIYRISLSSVEVTIHNNVEKLQNGSVIGGIGLIWLPTKDKTNEVGRIIKNMAYLLNLSVPTNISNLATNKDVSKQ